MKIGYPLTVLLCMRKEPGPVAFFTFSGRWTSVRVLRRSVQTQSAQRACGAGWACAGGSLASASLEGRGVVVLREWNRIKGKCFVSRFYVENGKN